MTTSLQNIANRPHQPPTSTGTRPSSGTDTQEEDGTSFDDLMPGDGGSSDSAESSEAKTAAPVRTRTHHHGSSVEKKTDLAASQGTYGASSVRQALVSASATTAPDSAASSAGDPSLEPVDDGTGGAGLWSGASPTTPKGADTDPIGRPPLIAPHGPPTATGIAAPFPTSASIDDDTTGTGDPSDPTAAPTKLPPIMPHGPVDVGGDDDDGDGTAAPVSGPLLPTVIGQHPPGSDSVQPPAGDGITSVASDPNLTASLGTNVAALPKVPTGPITTTPIHQPATRPDAAAAAFGVDATAGPKSPGTPAIPPSPSAPMAVTNSAQAQLATAASPADASANPAATIAAAENSAGLLADGANLAVRPAAVEWRSAQLDQSQDTSNEGVNPDSISGGTTVAKQQANVNTTSSNSTIAVAPDASSSEGAGGWDDAPAFGGAHGDTSRTGRAKDGDAATAVTSSSFASTLSAATPEATTTAASANPSAGFVQAENMQSLIDHVQQTAQQAKLDGSGQVELRVRLQGVSEGVTVRIQLDADRQSQVSFQTGSPELRAALEQGWNDLAAASSAPNAAPDFSESTSTFSSSAASSASSASTADTTTAAGSFYRAGRPVSTAPASTGGDAARRWSGYA